MTEVAASATPETSPDVSRELDERRLQVVAEQARGLRWQIVATALVVAAIAWTEAPTAAVVAWWIAVVVAREWRAGLLHRITSDRSTPIADRLRTTIRSNALLGACNGSAALFMLWLDPARDAILTMILVSWGAGAVSTSSTVMRAFVAYAAFLFVPTALMWFVSGSALGVAIGALVLMFFGVQSRFARRNLETFEESYRIRLENDALARSLQAEREQLAAARDIAVQANQEKSRFLAAASHDLRQPLQAMSLNVGALQRVSMAGEPGAIVDDVALSLAQLRSMLDALLDLSKLDAGMVVPQLRAVQVDRLLAALDSSFRALAADKGLALRIDCPTGLAARTDAELLRRMLANLLDNAIKFTPRGAIDITARRDGAHVEIAVRDSGPGIAPEHHRSIFDDLIQLDPRPVRGERGHGLGLGIVRRLAKLLLIDVALESATGEGATFRLRIPAASESDQVPEPSAAAWSLQNTSVLVLDDDAMVRGAYAHALASMRCQSVMAAHVDEAIDKLRERPMQAAVVDYQLVGANGFDAIARLRDGHPQLPVVMVTASVDPAVDATAAAQGIRLLHKPVDAASLGQALSQLLGTSSAAR
jgi:signal transduction histidine kinase/ActR/RegA family two-component response regulator